ncbi:GAF domain-containing protein [Labedella gwakjiensis]|uniref:Sensor-like histidine kinase SenX3 n=1 Tax=Labedella gwakjiensis TaxID=390269 RepID=A0A2P8GYW3_9MICO|nr:GAF domain-containing protein [Labedella gwakjiensis]RUQ86410.1 sensor histidine kinase [Labedella gwakjiensis]
MTVEGARVRTAEEITRRSAIDAYEVVGAPPRADLESLVQLAATLCGVSKAVINIIDDRFQHQVAAVGMEPASCTREDSMCARVFQRPGHVTVRDARLDERFADNPFVTGEVANVRFYASSPLITPAGIPIGTLCVFDEDAKDLDPHTSEALKMLAHQVVDVLELHRISTELEKSNEQLAQFAGQVSHDLRNPLMAVSGFLELATDSPEMVNAPEAAKALARAESAADRMARMITDLLHFARVGGTQPRRVPIDLEDLVSSVLEDLHAPIEQTGATVVVDAPFTIVGDETLLGAVVQNLVANALKFSAVSGAMPRIEVHAHEVSAGWRVSVDDNGPGVPRAQRERVFDLMERAVGDEVAGLGIGLSTCRLIVQAHGGSIGIDDSALGGASVWMVLPSVA